MFKGERILLFAQGRTEIADRKPGSRQMEVLPDFRGCCFWDWASPGWLLDILSSIFLHDLCLNISDRLRLFVKRLHTFSDVGIRNITVVGKSIPIGLLALPCLSMFRIIDRRDFSKSRWNFLKIVNI